MLSVLPISDYLIDLEAREFSHNHSYLFFKTAQILLAQNGYLHQEKINWDNYHG